MKISFLLIFVLFLSFAIAQPANDACVNPISIPNVINFCSAVGAGTTVAATDDVATSGGFSVAGCWGGTVNDVWYSFVAVASDVTIVINGNQGSPVGGTLVRPQVALYSGTCATTINELACGSPPSGTNIIQIYKGGLTIGETYLIRVDGVNANKGTFQYCINNYNPVPSPKSDCPTAVVLCDKSGFNVPAVSGAGTNASEMNSATCLGYDPIFSPGNVETNSAWYVFTFKTSGTFTFVLNPTNPNDDLDFVVYKLPNGVGNCAGKTVQRCEASQCPPNWITGLNTTATDISEDGGCASGQDNFLKQLTVVAGETYAIGINNFTSTGNGFNINFGGTAEIQGPTSIINDSDPDDIICVNEAITFTDASTPPPLGTLVQWIWNFGPGATPSTFSGQNPPAVTYSTNGVKTISLTVKSDKGCLVTSTKNITVTTQPPTVVIAVSQNNICPNTNVTFTATPTNGGTAPTYQWYKNNVLIPGEVNATYTSSTLANNDQIKVVLTSNSSCALPNTATSNIITMVVTSPLPVDVSISGNTPICPSATLTLTANPTNGGATPAYQWFVNGNPVGTNSNTYAATFNNNDVVTVRLTSSLGCVSNNPKTSNPITVTIKPNPVVSVTSPSICSGQTAQPIASGATTYTWTGGLSPVANPTTPTLTTTTTYTVTGTTNGCSSTATSTVTVKPNPTISVTSPNICSGQTAQPIASGATTYTWTGGLSPIANPTTPALTTTTTYTVTGALNGCFGTATSTVTVKPNPVVSVTSPSICSGQTAQPIASGATTYTWTGGLSSVSNPTTPILNSTTTYTVTGTLNGCFGTATSTVTVKPNPTVSVTSPSICSGQTAQPIASGATTYTWTGGLSAIANPTTPVLTTNQTYTVTGNLNGCFGTATSNVTVKANPVVSVTSPSICSGQTAQPIASGATTYTWTGGLPSVSNPTTPILTSNQTYTVTGTTNGCFGTATSIVTVKPNPVVSVSSPSICNGQTAQPIASGATTYTWTGGLSSVSNPTTPVLNSTTTYTVTGTLNGCFGTAVSTITVKPNPVVSVTSPSICSGQTAQPIASGATTYAWTGGLSSTSNPTTPVLTTNQTYTVTGNLNGCFGTATSNITVKANPVVNVTSPSICSGQTAQPVASGATTYTWTGGLSSVSNPTTPILNTTTTYTVTGTLNGCVGTAVSTVTVKPNPVVTVTNGNICTGQTAILTASGATTYTWSNGLGSSATVTTPVLSADQTYTVTGTTNGCFNTAIATVTVRPSLLVSVNNPSICSGQTANLLASGANNYTWTGGLSSVANPTTPVLTTTQTYTVTGETNGCFGTAIATVTVKLNPIISVTSPSICSGQTAQPIASGATTYTWTGGLSSISNPTTPVLTTTQTYTVTGETNGCFGSATSTVTVKPNPVVTVTSQSICNGQTAQPIASGATTYTWTGGLASVSNPITPILTSTQTYTVTGEINGCFKSATSTITVKPNPIVAVTSPSICSGQTAQPIASGATTYTWSGGLNSVANPTTAVLTSNQTYTVTGTTNGCFGSAISNVTVKPNPVVTVTSPEICSGQTAQPIASGATTYTWTGGLNPIANPTTPILTSNQPYTVTGTTNGCFGQATSNVLVKPTKTTNITRSICSNDSVVIGTKAFNQTGIHTVVLQTSQGCDSTVILNLTVSNVLTPSVSIVASKTDICPGDVVKFTASAINTGVPPSYQWFVNNIAVGNNNAIFSTSNLNNNDVVKVVVTTTAQCAIPKVATSNLVNITLNSINYIKPTVEYCIGDSQLVDLGVTTNSSNGYTIKWTNNGIVTNQSNISTYTFNNTNTTNVPFEITYGNNCVVRDVLNVKVNPLPNINAVVDIPRAKYEELVQLDVITNASLNYNWIPSSILNFDTIKNPVAEITASTVFIVFVEDTRTKCKNSDSVAVELIDECTEDFIYVPTGFSPNRDGINDCFGIVSPPKLSDFNMVIFDRWGEKVFEAFDKNTCWNGTYKGEEAMTDSYPYIITFKCYNGKILSKKGTITIIR